MRLLAGDAIGKAVRNCQPCKVACAYVGVDWQELIGKPKALDAIIVSPTIGSNPDAIAELVELIGWERVFFLDNLHAKLYIGARSVIIGSANLTRNGLGGNGLIELCVELKSRRSVQKVNDIFDALKDKAISSYRDTKAKEGALRDLYAVWNRAVSDRVIQDRSTNKRRFSQFELHGYNHFYVAWYESDDGPAYSTELESLAGSIEYEMHFSPEDKVEPDKWVLCWRKTANNMPSRRENPWWMYIHQIFENGIPDKDYEYPVCAVQWKGKAVPPVPFELEEEVIKAFNWALQQRGVAEYLIQPRSTYNLNKAMRGIPPLIEKMRKRLKLRPRNRRRR